MELKEIENKIVELHQKQLKHAVIYVVDFKEPEKDTRIGYICLPQALNKYEEYKRIATGISCFVFSHKINFSIASS